MADASSLPQRRIAERTSVGGLSIVLLLFLLAICAPIFFNFGTTLLSPIRLFLTLSFVPLAIVLVTSKTLRINIVDVLIVCYLLWSIMAIGSRHPGRIVEWGGALTLEVLGAYLVGRVFIRDRDSFIAFTKLVGFIVVITLPFAIIESQTGIPVIPDFLDRIGWATVQDINNPPRMGMERAQTIFAHPIHYGVFASAAFALTWVALAGEVSTFRRTAMCVAIFACCFLSLSSGAFLAVLMQIGLIGWYVVFRNHPRKWTIFFSIVVGIYLFLEIAAEAPPIRIFMRYASFSAHTAYWRATIFEWGMINVWSSPWIGIGLANWVRPHWMPSASVDNYWLVHAMRTGIPSFVFIAGAFLSMLWKLSRRDFTSDEQLNRLRRAYIFVLAGLIFSLATVHVWTNVHSYIYLFLASGAWMLTAEPRGAEEDGPAPPPTRRRQAALARPGAAKPRYSRFPSGGFAPAARTASRRLNRR